MPRQCRALLTVQTSNPTACSDALQSYGIQDSAVDYAFFFLFCFLWKWERNNVQAEASSSYLLSYWLDCANIRSQHNVAVASAVPVKKKNLIANVRDRDAKPPQFTSQQFKPLIANLSPAAKWYLCTNVLRFAITANNVTENSATRVQTSAKLCRPTKLDPGTCSRTDVATLMPQCLNALPTNESYYPCYPMPLES